MEFIAGLAMAIVGAVALLVVLGFVLPDRQRVSRSIVIAAPPASVFGHIGDFERWSDWSPWAQIDPDMDMRITGSGVGQRMEWSSDYKNVGNGSQEIVAMEPDTMMQTRLEFGDMGGANARFDLKPVDAGTEVFWSLETRMREGVPLMRQPMATFFGFMMDKMVGADYEKGLAKLKQVVEAS